MATWTRVKWTEAGQVTDLPEDDVDARSDPADYFERLRQAGRLTDAAFFLGEALPRLETVAWAARTVRDAPAPGRSHQDADALRCALLWVQDPSEPRRRAAYETAMAATDRGAERMVALAAFFSGGSIAPEGCPPVQAPKDAAGAFAAGAVVLAAARSGDMDAALVRSLDLGQVIAEEGLAGDV
jgi:hypothetical protein